MTRAFRFGVTLQPIFGGRSVWSDAVKLAEDCGFSTVTVMDHFSSGGIWSALMAAHNAAPSLRLGTLVVNNELRHPLLLAREAIATDVLTGGRFELGIGAGWDLDDFRAVGMSRRPVPERLERLAEALEILSQACAGERPLFRGRHFSVDAPENWPRPQQAPIPLLVGGGGKRVLELAATVADTISISRNMQRGPAGSWRRTATGFDGGAARVEERLDWIRAAAGERFSQLELHAIVNRVIVTRNPSSAAAAAGRALGLSVEDVLESPHFLVGTVEQVADTLEQRRERWGISYWTLSSGNSPGGNSMRDFGEVIARISS
ncbi:MAG TPA: TIGR03621 family F420-dependent LLM class oxidoreductase [Gaiellaceae bacterium]|nr:TIGR03621 family F420-dependent LLM class oxidoreductase [Gaiellaceae bacterium]